jgi:capsular polysaccharide biosynthesis protein
LRNMRSGDQQRPSPMDPGIDWDNNPRGKYVDEEILSLRDLIRVIRRRIWVIVLTTTVLVGCVVGFGLMEEPTYVASVKVVLGQGGEASSDLGSKVQGLQEFVPTVAQAIESRPLAQSVIERLGLSMSPETFLSKLSVDQVTDTTFIEVYYNDPDPERAKLVINTVGTVLSEHVSELQSSEVNPVTAKVWERAEVSYPAGSNLMRNVFLALVSGLIIGLVAAFLLDYFDDSWKSPDEVEQLAGVPTLGTVPASELHRSKRRSRSRRSGPIESG